MQDKVENGHDDSIRMGRIGYRPYWVLNLALVVRALHQVGAAVFLAAYLLDAIPGPPVFYLVLAFVSGGVLFVAEWLRHRESYREASGITSISKALFLGAAFHGFLPQQATVLLVFIIASVMAHAPKRIRHRLLY